MKLTDKRKTIISDLSLLAIAMMWGASFVVVKNSISTLAPMWVISLRFLVAASASWLFFFKKLRKPDKKSVMAGLLCGVVMFVAFVFQTYGAVYTTAGKNALLTVLYVVLVPFCYWIFTKSPPTPLQIVAAIADFVGIGLLVLGNGFGAVNTGDLLTLVCGVLFAVHIALVGVFSRKYDPLILTVMQLSACAVLATVFAPIFCGTPERISSDAWLSVLYLGFFSTFVAYAVQTVAQKYTAPSHVSLITSMESAFGCLFSVLIFHDEITVTFVAGTVISFGAVIAGELGDIVKRRV